MNLPLASRNTRAMWRGDGSSRLNAIWLGLVIALPRFFRGQRDPLDHALVIQPHRKHPHAWTRAGTRAPDHRRTPPFPGQPLVRARRAASGGLPGRPRASAMRSASTPGRSPTARMPCRKGVRPRSGYC